jgi:hypothetical protein
VTRAATASRDGWSPQHPRRHRVGPRQRKVTGKAEGVDGLRKLLGKRFDGNGRKAEPVPSPVPPPTAGPA